jgi:hypothetical protein
LYILIFPFSDSRGEDKRFYQYSPAFEVKIYDSKRILLMENLSGFPDLAPG